jgi:hypothetical protein
MILTPVLRVLKCVCGEKFVYSNPSINEKMSNQMCVGHCWYTCIKIEKPVLAENKENCGEESSV